MLENIILTLNILCALYGVYFVVVILLGMSRKHAPHPAVPAKKRIAAVIAARNEEPVIADSVQTLLAQRYPEALFDVWVVPNNCTDNTAEVARQAGAQVLECTVPVKCKGDVLAFAFEELLSRKDYDAFCIFDADNLVDPGFLAAANNALCAGELVAQGYRESKNPEESWISGSMSIFFWFMSRFFNRGRSALGMSAMLNGTGIVLSADLIRKNGWNTHTLTEDLEYTAQCGLMGVKIGWMENAVIYDEQPNSFVDSFEQRRRWFAGTLQCMRRYGGALWARAFKHRSLQALDFALFFTGSITQFICLIPGVLSCLLMILQVIKKGGLGLLLLDCGGMLLALYLACVLGAAVMCLLARKTTARMWPAILTFALFMASWVPANLCAVLVKAGWRPIAHTSRVRLPEVMQASSSAKTKTETEIVRHY